MLLFHDYTEMVKADYVRKCELNEIGSNLAIPSPASLKEECEIVFKERSSKKDAQALRAFFGAFASDKELLQLIQNFDIDRFKPLVNYLKGRTQKTEEKNIELLAWLIGFETRPFVLGKTMSVTKEESAETEKKFLGVENLESIKETSGIDTKQQEQSSRDTSSSHTQSLVNIPERFSEPSSTLEKKRQYEFPTKTVAFLLMMIGFCAWAFFAIIQNRDGFGGFGLRSESGCMYWDQDHYEEIDCNSRKSDIIILPMNSERMKEFKKIIRVDTITENSIGKIWYLQTNKEYEFFTAGGRHPVYTTRMLRKLTDRIFQLHLRKTKSLKLNDLQKSSLKAN